MEEDSFADGLKLLFAKGELYETKTLTKAIAQDAITFVRNKREETTVRYPEEGEMSDEYCASLQIVVDALYLRKIGQSVLEKEIFLGIEITAKRASILLGLVREERYDEEFIIGAGHWICNLFWKYYSPADLALT